jgi:transposase
MDKKRTYFPATTAQQRCLLFEAWEDTGERDAACRRAHVSWGTFYKWQPRFEAGGYAALAEPSSRAPKDPHQTPPEKAAPVLALRRQYPEWGKRRITDELAKGNNWVPLVSPNTVKRILQDAGLWPAAAPTAKKGGPAIQARTADLPGQALNSDLCFVPVRHAPAVKLPAVSGSAGRLVIEQPADTESKRTWPGQVFANENLDYAEAMLEFVTASKAAGPPLSHPESPESRSIKAQKRALHQAEQKIRAARRVVRAQRSLADQAWAALKTEHQTEKAPPTAGSGAEPQAQDAPWRVLRAQRPASLVQRNQQEQSWRQERQTFRERWWQLPISAAWIAILVITDNCTRQCLAEGAALRSGPQSHLRHDRGSPTRFAATRTALSDYRSRDPLHRRRL